ncbi:MAG: alpha-amylase family glycosyl hydrolase [Candidatus Villigracilaceae bacterium]
MRKPQTLLHMLQLTVRGVPCMYYGEEIGMRNLRLPLHTALDPLPRKYKAVPQFVFDLLGTTINRDQVRAPMQWDASPQAGFSSAAQSWLPVHENYPNVNVARQSGDPDSLLETLRRLLKIRRQQPALSEGSLQWIDTTPASILAYRRAHTEGTLAIFLNFSTQAQSFAFEAEGLIFSLSSEDTYQNGSVHLSGYGGLILTTPH